MVDELYKRQEELNLSIPDKVCIIGVGGIGSWVALNMGVIGVQELILIDYDKIEPHNLNRTLFKTSDIGVDKVTAVTELIMERRSDIRIRGFSKRIESLAPFELKELEGAFIIDCRDVLEELPLETNKLVKLGYDGLSITLILNPKYGKIWDLEPDETGYDIVPSFLAPCQFLSTAIVTLLTDPEFNIEEVSNKIKTVNIEEHFKDLVK